MAVGHVQLDTLQIIIVVGVATTHWLVWLNVATSIRVVGLSWHSVDVGLAAGLVQVNIRWWYRLLRHRLWSAVVETDH